MTALSQYEQAVASAIIGIDTVWGGDVNCRSGTGRVIADSYFSWKELPPCYHGVEAEVLRKSGGVSSKTPERTQVRTYLDRWPVGDFIKQMVTHAKGFDPLRRQFVQSLASALEVQLDLALERIEEGPPVSYERCVVVAMGEPAQRVDPSEDREEVARILRELGRSIAPGPSGLIEAVDAFRKETWVGHEGITQASQRVIARLGELTAEHVTPHLPESLRGVPLSNVKFCPIQDAWFSGSMNYLGREKKPNGEPAYEAEYEINVKIEKSSAEFEHLVAHEVVPGHVATFALLQHLYHTGKAGFEATVLTMNTRHSALFEGVANAGLLLAHGARKIEELPNLELQLGMRLSQLEDAAKSNASFDTYVGHLPSEEIKRRLREECLATQERANKLTDAWAAHPLMGRAYMPSYRHGTDIVLRLLEKHGPEKMIPILYGARGICDCVTVHQLVDPE